MIFDDEFVKMRQVAKSTLKRIDDQRFWDFTAPMVQADENILPGVDFKRSLGLKRQPHLHMLFLIIA